MTQACVPPEELVGFGALLQYKNPINDEWTTVAGTKDLETPEDSTEAIDTTSNDTEGGYKTNMPSPLSELSEVSYTMNFRWSQWKTLVNMKANRTVTEWRMVLMNTEQTYLTYCAWIQMLKSTWPMEELVEAEITLQPTGAPTWGQLN